MSDFKPDAYKLLIVDDLPQNIQVLGNVLRDQGYQLSFAMDGRTALTLIKKEKYDLILLDVMMPDLDGYDVCDLLKQDPLHRDIPVIFLTAKIDVGSIVKGFKLGAVDYITKPFHSEELLLRVQTHLELKTTREKLAQSNMAKDKFFSIISHDLKNPFHALLGFSELLISHFDTLDRDKAMVYIQNIHNSGKSLYKLLENLLHWSRLQTGGIKCNPEGIDLLAAVEQCLATLHSSYTIKKIHIVNTIDSGIMLSVDSDMIELILRNLISNAIKFSDKGGEIQIDSKSIDDFVEIAISDTGTGIKAEDIPTLFKIDTRHSMPGTSGEKGTGLGLILCQEFIELNKGKLWVESQIGQGSVFKFTLPLYLNECEFI